MGLGQRFADALHPRAAQDYFTDRVTEREAFDGSVRAYAQSIAQLSEGRWRAQDLTRHRRNVLTFYGVGGIGKTTLLTRLEDRLVVGAHQPDHWPSLSLPFRGVAVAHVDMARDASSASESLLVAIRTALLSSGVESTAFDLFLGAFWSSAHPNERLADRLPAKSRLARAASRFGLEQHVQSALGDIASSLFEISTVGIAGYKVAQQLVILARNSTLRKGAFRDCQMLDELVSDLHDPDAMSYSAHLLAWDLEKAQQRVSLGTVVLVDTVEEMSRSGMVELERIAWLLPNVLFVLAGRNRIRWIGTTAGVPVIAGVPVSWPGLNQGATGEPRQHLIGNLSDNDARDFLIRRLGDRVHAGIVNAIIKASGGLPLQLDLSVQRYLQIEIDRFPKPSDFDLSFDELAVGVLRDLDVAEQRALLACCLADSVDERLVQVSANLDRVGPVRVLFGRSLLEIADQSMYGRSLHPLFRRALLTADDLGLAQYSEYDWSQSAARMVTELVARVPLANVAERRYIVAQLAAIVLRFDLALDELCDISRLIFLNDEWGDGFEPGRLAVLSGAQINLNRRSHTLVQAIVSVVGRQKRSRKDVAGELSDALAQVDEDDQVFDFARYFLAESLRDIGDVRRSDAIMTSLMRREGEWSSRALHGHIHILRRMGRFKEVGELIEQHQVDLPHWRRLRGDLHWTQCLLERAASDYREEAGRPDNSANASELATCWASIAYVESWLRPNESTDAVRRAEDILGSAYHSFSYLMIGVARIICADDFDEAQRLHSDVCRQANEVKASSLKSYAHLALAFQAAVARDDQALRQAFALAREASDGRQLRYIVVIIGSWLGSQAIVDKEDWLDEAALLRWRRLPDLRRGLGRRVDHG